MWGLSRHQNMLSLITEEVLKSKNEESRPTLKFKWHFNIYDQSHVCIKLSLLKGHITETKKTCQNTKTYSSISLSVFNQTQHVSLIEPVIYIVNLFISFSIHIHKYC